MSTQGTELALERGQQSLFGRAKPGFDPALRGIQRTLLGDGAWVDHLPGLVAGHETVLDTLWSTTRWQSHRRRMYDRVVDVPRLEATLPDDGPGHPLVHGLAATLTAHYGRDLHRVSMNAYRDGRDSVAFHGDRLGRHTDDAIVAIVSFGDPRRFLLRPAQGGRSRSFDLGWGDLLVMGGSCQRTWQHAVPKAAEAGLRISVQFRSAAADS